MDRGCERWVLLGAFRALRGGDGERTVGADEALILKVEAVVLEELPSLLFKLELANKAVVLAHGAGAAAGKNWVRLLPGDRVEVEFAEHDLTRGRIVKRIG